MLQAKFFIKFNATRRKCGEDDQAQGQDQQEKKQSRIFPVKKGYIRMVLKMVSGPILIKKG